MTHLRTSLLSGLALGAAILLVPVVVHAQAVGDPVPAPAGMPSIDDPPVPAPGPPAPVYSPTPTAPAPTPPPVAGDSMAVTTSAPATARPDGMSFGLGISYVLGGAQIDRPDGASLRFRLASGLTLEPFVRLATHGQSMMDGDFKDAQNEFIVGSVVRLPVKSRGKVDLVGQVGGGLSVFINDPDGDDNNTTTTTLSVIYGLSLEYWFNSNWNLSFTARNPLVSYQNVGFQISDSQTETKSEIGVIWDPVVDLALHLFF